MAGKKKQKSQLLRRGGAAVAGLSLLVSGAFTAVAENAQATVDPANAVDLDQVPVQRDSEGRVIQVLPEEPLAAPVRGASPAKAAEAYAPGLAETFAAQGVGEFVVDKVFPMGQGSTVRLSQEIDSIPVFGATITQALDQEGALISALGSAAQQVQGSYPTPAEQQLPGAEETALKTIQDDYQAIGARVYASDAAWYTPGSSATSPVRNWSHGLLIGLRSLMG